MKNCGKAKISNGSSLFLHSVDGRGREARRYRDLLNDVHEAMGGHDGLSTLEQLSVRRLAGVLLLSEMLEARLAQGDSSVTAREYSDLVGRANELTKQLGLGACLSNAVLLDESDDT